MADEPYVFEFNTFGTEENGILSIIEGEKNLPFDIKRVYWISKVSAKETRGHHAHIENRQVLCCLNGSITITLKDQQNNTTSFTLLPSNKGLFVPNMLWKEITFNNPNSILLALASKEFDDTDYIKSWDEFAVYKK
jgi:dTDP-4-dehydrorhamnose 3,5-epimerase-like enzyme